LFLARVVDLRQVYGVGDIVATAISNFDVDRATDHELGLAEKEDIRILTLTSEVYPELLQSIYDPPPVLHVKGKPLNSVSFPLTVVGTRNPSEYGKII
jgi:DNA processing protein